MSPTSRTGTAWRGRPGATGARRAGRRGLGGEQVEGRHAVRELLAAGRRATRDVWIAEGMDRAEVLEEIAGLAAGRGVPVRRVARSVLETEAVTEVPQGVLAHAAGLPEAALATLCAEPRAFLVVLDGVGDPGNVGAIARSALAAGATGAVLGRHRSAPITPAATKAAAGAVEHLPMAMASGIPAALSELSGRGVWTVGLAPDSGDSLFDLDLGPAKVALVLGSEGRGLGRLSRQRCDVVVRIPIASPVESLSVSAAAAVACFELSRHRRREAR